MTLFWKRMRNPLFVKSAIMLLQLIWKYFRPFIQSKAASLQAAVRLFTGAASGEYAVHRLFDLRTCSRFSVGVDSV